MNIPHSVKEFHGRWRRASSDAIKVSLRCIEFANEQKVCADLLDERNCRLLAKVDSRNRLHARRITDLQPFQAGWP